MWYQSAFSPGQKRPEPDRPYGVFILPKTGRKLVIEKDTQHLIGGPAIWKKAYELSVPQ